MDDQAQDKTDLRDVDEPVDPIKDQSNTPLIFEDEYAGLKLNESCYGPLLMDHFGRYRLIKLLGAGKQGQVFMAIDRQFRNSSGSVVAIKVFRNLGSIEGVQAKRVDHPRVVRVIDQGVDPRDGSAYVVYDYLTGQSIKGWAIDQDLSTREIARLMSMICGATEAIHARSIIHRDLKPGNVIMHGDDPVIVDFGIASQGLNEPTLAGSPAYMAPEQRDGVGESIMADVYGLGGIAYYMITGQPPNNEQGDPPDKATLAQINDRRLRAIITKCLSADVLARYQSVHALRDDFEAILNHKPISVYKQSPISRTWLFARRYPLAVLIIAILSISLTLVAEGLVVSRNHAQSLSIQIERGDVRESHTRVLIEQLVLDHRMSDSADPTTYWMITKLFEGQGSDWIQGVLESDRGANRLARLIEQRIIEGTESTVTIGFWWWLLADVYQTMGHDVELVKETLYKARSSFYLGLDYDDPIVSQLSRRIEGIE